MFLPDLYTYLTSRTELTSLIGTKIFPGLATTATALPYLTYEINAYDGTWSLGGPSKFSEHVIQFDALGNTESIIDSISDALRNILDGYQGTMGDEDVRYIRFLTEIDSSSVESESASQVKIHRRTIDYVFVRAQQLPTAT